MDGITHFEIPARHPEKTTEFYKKLFGWQIQAMPEMSYWMATTVKSNEQGRPVEPGGINGGFWKGEPGDKPVLVINVPDIDGTAKRIEQAGGKIIMPTTKVGDMGLYARFQDPEGNVLGIWQTLTPG